MQLFNIQYSQFQFPLYASQCRSTPSKNDVTFEREIFPEQKNINSSETYFIAS